MPSEDPSPQLVVRNTFLDFSDDTEALGPLQARRPRVISDLSDMRLGKISPFGTAHLGNPMSVNSGLDAPAARRKASRDYNSLPAVSEEAAPSPGVAAQGSWPPGFPGAFPGMPGMLPGYPMPGQYPAPFAGYPGMHPYGYGPGMMHPYLANQAAHAAAMQAAAHATAHATASGSSQKSGRGGGSPKQKPGGKGGRGRGGEAPSFGAEFKSGGRQAAQRASAPELSVLESAKTAKPSSKQSSPPGPDVPPPPNATTVMLRNIPNGYTQEMILQLLNERGFQGLYDFVYLPMDFRNGVNLGYAFVNVQTHDHALSVMQQLQGFTGWFFDSSKVCEVSWAHPHQGLAEHVERYRNSPVMHPSMPDVYKPMLFQNLTRIPFPAPTKAIRAPKLRPAREKNAAGTLDGVATAVAADGPP